MDMESSLPERDDENGRLCWLPDSDPAFRLFGKLIALPMTAENAACESGIAQIQEEENSLSDDDRLSLRGVDKLGVSSGSNSGSDEEAIPRPRNEGAKDEFEKPGDPNAEARNCEQGLEETKVKISSAAANQDKALLKPDKPVPCPRCESMDTKFCYFNNYNLSQPRHFCRSCQRYWTAGGTLRNVPVGAGRRKTKHSSSQQKQSSLASSSIVSREDDPNGAQPLLNCSLPQVAGFKSGPGRPHPPLESHIPSVEPRYCPDSSSSSSSLSSSLTSLTADMPYHGDLPPSFKSMLGVRIPEVRVPQMQDDPGSSSSHTKIKIDAETANEPKMALPNGVSDSSEGSNTTEANREWKHNPGRYSSTADLTPTADLAPGSDSSINGERVAKADSTCVEAEFWLNGLVSPCFGGVWPYMFSMGWPGAGQPPINAAPLAGASNGLWQWPPFSGPVWGPQGLSFPWSLPWNAAAAVAANANAVIAGGTLGKRPRRVSEGMSDGSLCIPKTLRIHDPEEAARSSILKTLGVCNKTESLSSGGFFNAFQPKAEVFQPKPGMKNSEGSLLAKHANPAAMARSMTFQGNM